MRFCSFVAMMICLCGFANAQVKVGNNGDGILVHGKPFLIDLVQLLIHEDSPELYIGDSWSNKTVGRILVFKLEDMGVDILTLAKKMNDIDTLYPGLSDELLIWINGFEYVYAQENELKLTDLNNKPLAPLTFPLAVRSNTTVYLNEKMWKRLNAHNKVALLIHESTSHILSVMEAFPQCRFKSPRIRDMVGHLFLRDTYLGPNAKEIRSTITPLAKCLLKYGGKSTP